MTKKELAIQALEQMKGDDLWRAMAAFDGMSPEQMREQHGKCGKSRQEVLDGYLEREKAANEALDWIKSL